MSRFRAPQHWEDYCVNGFEPSADGYDYWYVGGSLNGLFGMYVFKQHRTGTEPAVLVAYPAPLMTGRGPMFVSGDGKLRIAGNTTDKDKVAREEIVPGFVPYTVGKVPAINTVIDQDARAMATNAAQIAQIATSQTAQTLSAITAVRSDVQKVNKRIDTLPAPVSDAEIADIAWSKMQDFMGTPDFFAKVKAIAQQVLLEAIAYANKATAAQSKLRALIESIKG